MSSPNLLSPPAASGAAAPGFAPSESGFCASDGPAPAFETLCPPGVRKETPDQPPAPVTEGATVVARDEARKPQERLPVEGARAEAIPIDLAGVCGVVPAGPMVNGVPEAPAGTTMKPDQVSIPAETAAAPTGQGASVAPVVAAPLEDGGPEFAVASVLAVAMPAPIAVAVVPPAAPPQGRAEPPPATELPTEAQAQRGGQGTLGNTPAATGTVSPQAPSAYPGPAAPDDVNRGPETPAPAAARSAAGANAGAGVPNGEHATQRTVASTPAASGDEAASPTNQASTGSREGGTGTPGRRAGRTPTGAAAGEKSAASISAREIATDRAGQKEILTADNELVAKNQKTSGTDVALQAGMMNPPLMSPRLLSRSGLRLDAGSATGTFDEGDGLSVTWKGWTNGGGERASTAAQFSRLGGSTSAPQLAFAGAPAFASGRLRAGAAETSLPAARAFPLDAESLLAPLGTAIERLVLTGRDQLSLTVRFGEGGSLSLKLVLRNGEIATQIQTDVPGLEGALRSSWNQLAQEWHGRGLKLGQPEFVGGEVSDGRGQGFGRQGRGADRESNEQGSDLPAWRAAFPAPSRRPAHSAAAAATTPAVPGLGHPGLETWA